MPDEIKLKPCPFCGSQPNVLYRAYSTAIGCSNNQCIIYAAQPLPFNDYGHRDAATRAWNTRI